MIKEIHLKNVSTYGNTGTTLTSLEKVNFIFGTNGTGKTTLSRVIKDPSSYENCAVEWEPGTECEVLVYNRDYIDEVFGPSISDVQGIFTLGIEDKERTEAISIKKSSIDELDRIISKQERNLHGDDTYKGVYNEITELEEEFKKYCWEQKRRVPDSLTEAFQGLNSNKVRFRDEVIQQHNLNKADLQDEASLIDKAQTLFGKRPNERSTVEGPCFSQLIQLESSPILNQVIVGKRDVSIANMIEKLGNNDWVYKGREYFDRNGNICPFCQRETNELFRKSLSEYFDETFESSKRELREFRSHYYQLYLDAQSKMEELTNHKFSEMHTIAIENAVSRIHRTVKENIDFIESKINEPSQKIKLTSISSDAESIENLIGAENARIEEHNKMVREYKDERSNLIDSVWKLYLEKYIETQMREYLKKKSNLEKKKNGIESKREDCRQKRQTLKTALSKLEMETTSIEPTIKGINGLLKAFGFSSFNLDKSQANGYYKVVRNDGSTVERTLSEGERSFITFLYFFHLLNGSHSKRGETGNRIVVFDDPVSSMDCDVLYVVSSLIRSLFTNDKGGTNDLQQFFILTHNVYFHKEVSFNGGNTTGRKKDDEKRVKSTYWVVKKTNNISTVESYVKNPIQTSYEMLWWDIRREGQKDGYTIGNTYRRIIEYYFKMIGGIDYNELCSKFDSEMQSICRSFFSWINDGSHTVWDDPYFIPSENMLSNYEKVFKDIFDKSGHIAHYDMMMGKELPPSRNVE